jgi:hypothetical protein
MRDSDRYSMRFPDFSAALGMTVSATRVKVPAALLD